MVKGFAAHSYILLIALFIDGLVAGLSFGLAGLVAAGSATIPFVGTAFVPVGILLGFVTSFSINATLGAGFLVFLGLKGLFYPEIAYLGMLGELLPGINNLPLWTAMAWRSIRKRVQQDAQKKKSGMGTSGEAEPEELLVSAAFTQAGGAESERPPLRAAPPEAANDNAAEESGVGERSHPFLKNPRMGSDVVPKSAPKPAGNNPPKQAYAA